MFLSKKEEFFKTIAEKENKKFFNGIGQFFQMFIELINSSSDSYSKVFFVVLFLAIILCLFCGFFYFFFLLILMFYFVAKKIYLFAIISLLNGISFIVCLLGNCGKVKCFCLYKPSQWLFFMILFDIIYCASSIGAFIIIISEKFYYSNDDFYGPFIFGLIGSLIYTIIFIVMHIKIAQKLSLLYKTLRTIETNVIKFCVFKYIEELKKNQN